MWLTRTFYTWEGGLRNEGKSRAEPLETPLSSMYYTCFSILPRKIVHEGLCLVGGSLSQQEWGHQTAKADNGVGYPNCLSLNSTLGCLFSLGCSGSQCTASADVDLYAFQSKKSGLHCSLLKYMGKKSLIRNPELGVERLGY